LPETRALRILYALADPNFALAEFCGAGSMPSRSPTRRNLQNEIAASVQISAGGCGLAEISIDRSQKVGAEFCRCEISSRILNPRAENRGADPNRKPAITIHAHKTKLIIYILLKRIFHRRPK
jgi:hypothetical protein